MPSSPNYKRDYEQEYRTKKKRGEVAEDNARKRDRRKALKMGLVKKGQDLNRGEVESMSGETEGEIPQIVRQTLAKGQFVLKEGGRVLDAMDVWAIITTLKTSKGVDLQCNMLREDGHGIVTLGYDQPVDREDVKVVLKVGQLEIDMGDEMTHIASDSKPTTMAICEMPERVTPEIKAEMAFREIPDPGWPA